VRLQVDILNAAGVKQGAGPITDIISASVTRAFDGAGSFDFTLLAANPNADLLVNKRRVVLYLDYLGTRREIGRGIIDNIESKDSNGSEMTSVSGGDILNELKYASTLIGRELDNVTISSALTTLIGLASGWAVDTETAVSTDVISARFDGDTVLRAMQIIAENQGYHLRLGETGKTVEFGAFGASNGVILLKAGMNAQGGQNGSAGSPSNSDIGYISNITLKSQTEAIATRLYPLGAGQNADAALTLEFATRTSPYAVQSTSANGRTQYYIEDSQGVEDFGTIEKFGKFSKIAPLSNTVGDIENAANALYDAAAAWLVRNATAQTVLNVQVAGLTQTVRPGDKVRLMYKGRIYQGAQAYVTRDYDDDFWVLRVQESMSTSGVSVSLDLSNIDKQIQSEQSVVIGSIEELRINNMRVQPTFAPLPYYRKEDIDSTHSINIQMPVIGDTVFELNRAQLFIRTTPFRSNTTGTAAGGSSTETSAGGGDHNHIIMQNASDTPGGYSTRKFSMAYGSLSSPSIGFFDIPSSVAHAGSQPADYIVTASASGTHTHDVTLPSHTHDQTYGIFDDTDYPTSVTIEVNGATIVSGADPGGAGLENVIYDITSALKPPTAAALRQTHTIEISCASGQGSVECLVLLWCNFLPFKFGT
jgi:hypothetical protein